MIINYIEFKNIKSYGNKLQRINFDTEGNLILLTGTNGSGKSTIQDSIDLSLFNQVRGKETSKIPLKYFPNRLNKELHVAINFKNNNGDIIEIERKISPNEFSILKNNEPYTERFKILSEEEKEKLIGFNYNTFKSFISLSMNDFRNFIKLTTEDKRNLLNRLFNLEEIDMYYSINKELINQNKKEIERLTMDIVSINKTLKEYTSILKDKKNIENKDSKEYLKQKIKEYKENYQSKKDEINKIDGKISDYLIKIQENKNNINLAETENIKRRTELNDVNEKIKIYESGSCPYCSSDLNDEHHHNMLDELKTKKINLKETILNNDGLSSVFKENNISLIRQQRILEDSKDVLTDELNDIKVKVLSLKDKIENYDDSVDNILSEIKEKGSMLLKEKKEKENKILLLKEENETLNQLKDILSEDGIRKKIISSIVPPINETLSKLLDKINYPYDVVLDDNFDAIIYDKGEVIYNEIMSNGEIRMLSLCIAISYIEMVRKMNNINILFMDEVFQSVHKENINLILDLLKVFSKENNLNLILVHHGLEEVNPKIFDKIISVEKDFFSDIKIINNKI